MQKIEKSLIDVLLFLKNNVYREKWEQFTRFFLIYVELHLLNFSLVYFILFVHILRFLGSFFSSCNFKQRWLLYSKVQLTVNLIHLKSVLWFYKLMNKSFSHIAFIYCNMLILKYQLMFGICFFFFLFFFFFELLIDDLWVIK